MCIKLAKIVRMKRFKRDKSDKGSPKITIEEDAMDNDILLRAVKEIEAILYKEFGQDDIERIREDKELKFKFAARVVDRLFFYLSIIYFIVTFTTLVLAIPNFYHLQ